MVNEPPNPITLADAVLKLKQAAEYCLGEVYTDITPDEVDSMRKKCREALLAYRSASAQRTPESVFDKDAIQHGLKCAEIFTIKNCDKLNAGMVLTAIKEAQAAVAERLLKRESGIDELRKVFNDAAALSSSTLDNGSINDGWCAVIEFLKPYLVPEQNTHIEGGRSDGA